MKLQYGPIKVKDSKMKIIPSWIRGATVLCPLQPPTIEDIIVSLCPYKEERKSLLRFVDAKHFLMNAQRSTQHALFSGDAFRDEIECRKGQLCSEQLYEEYTGDFRSKLFVVLSEFFYPTVYCYHESGEPLLATIKVSLEMPNGVQSYLRKLSEVHLNFDYLENLVFENPFGMGKQYRLIFLDAAKHSQQYVGLFKYLGRTSYKSLNSAEKKASLPYSSVVVVLARKTHNAWIRSCNVFPLFWANYNAFPSILKGECPESYAYQSILMLRSQCTKLCSSKFHYVPVSIGEKKTLVDWTQIALLFPLLPEDIATEIITRVRDTDNLRLVCKALNALPLQPTTFSNASHRGQALSEALQVPPELLNEFIWSAAISCIKYRKADTEVFVQTMDSMIHNLYGSVIHQFCNLLRSEHNIPEHLAPYLEEPIFFDAALSLLKALEGCLLTIVL